MAFKRLRPIVKCSTCGRVLMPTADGRFRPHVRQLQARITPRLRGGEVRLCEGSGRRAIG